jgi:hypothetical protein
MTKLIVAFRNPVTRPKHYSLSSYYLGDEERSKTLRIGHAMAQAVSRRPLTAEARVRSRVSPCGICGGQSGTRTGFPPSTSVFSCQFHSTGAPLHGKTKKLIIFITGLHNKPQGCGPSLASAAEPFTTHKKKKTLRKNGRVCKVVLVK